MKCFWKRKVWGKYFQIFVCEFIKTEVSWWQFKVSASNSHLHWHYSNFLLSLNFVDSTLSLLVYEEWFLQQGYSCIFSPINPWSCDWYVCHKYLSFWIHGGKNSWSRTNMPSLGICHSLNPWKGGQYRLAFGEYVENLLLLLDATSNRVNQSLWPRQEPFFTPCYCGKFTKVF